MVVGVVRDVKQYGPDKPSSMAIYVPHAQYPASFMSLVVRTNGDPAEMIPTVRRAVQALDPDQVPVDAATMAQVMSDSIQTRRFVMTLLGLFAALALSLAAVGIYGVMSYSVTQRTHELGIRMALGASDSDVRRLILSRAVGITLAGTSIGAIGVFAVTRLMRGLLFGVEPTDAFTFFAVCGGLAVVALVASYVPARRATRVDPLVALRDY
jgi:putative ABC transport system permease protein